MCGIAGVISLSDAVLKKNKFKSMCDAIQHRGPDGAGYLLANTRSQEYFCVESLQNSPHLDQFNGSLFFGHRRLAILDLSSAGFQPMSDRSQKIWVTYNGEIYNFKLIRQELIALGYVFHSETDTEVLINAYLAWGIECVLKFNGMFAFALWDRERHKVFLVRDRYGIKPLYYTRTRENKIVFGSENKAILAYLDEKPALDQAGLLEYFTFQNFFTNKTLLDGIELLPAGHYLEIQLDQDQYVTTKQYWDFSFSESTEIKSEQTYIDELRFLFEQAVERQLVSDVEIGSYLSGGMDSGSITAVAAKRLPYMKTFTIGFDLHNATGIELGFDERAKSELLSYIYKTEQYEMVLKSGDMERCLSEFSWHLEEPRVGQSYPNFYAAKLASKFVKVVFSGAGGDECFGGYPWRYYQAMNNRDFTDYTEKYYHYWQRLLSSSELKELFSPIWRSVSHVSTQDIFKSVFQHHSSNLYSPSDYINHSLYFEAKTFLHGLLVVEDKLSMAHSLETRLPFLDNDLVDFAQKIPVNLKLNKLQDRLRLDENAVGDKSTLYYQKTNDGKLILRKALEKYMPSEYTNAIKQGFSSPDNSWFKGDSNDFVKRTLLSENAAIYDYMSKNIVSNIIREHFSGQKNRRLLIWSLINFEFFLRQYYNKV